MLTRNDITQTGKLNSLGAKLASAMNKMPTTSIQHGDYGTGVCVPINELNVMCGQYEPLKRYCEKHKCSFDQRMIALKDVLNFFDYEVHDPKSKFRGNHCDNTVGRYPLVMDSVFSIYKVTCIKCKDTGIYHSIDFSHLWALDRKAYERIRPKRIAFTIIYLLMKNVKEHFGEYLSVALEVELKGIANKYDCAMVFNKELMHNSYRDDPRPLLDGFVEVNEKSHIAKAGDTFKRVALHAVGKVIRYYVTKDVDETTSKPIHDFMVEMMTVCRELLITYSDVFKVSNLFAESRRLADEKVICYRSLAAKVKENIVLLKRGTDRFKAERIAAEEALLEDMHDEVELWLSIRTSLGEHIQVIEKLYQFKTIEYQIRKTETNVAAGFIIPVSFISDELMGQNIMTEFIGLGFTRIGDKHVPKDTSIVEMERIMLIHCVLQDTSEVRMRVQRASAGIKHQYDEGMQYFTNFDGLQSILKDCNVSTLKTLARINHRFTLLVSACSQYYEDVMARYAHAREADRDARLEVFHQAVIGAKTAELTRKIQNAKTAQRIAEQKNDYLARLLRKSLATTKEMSKITEKLIERCKQVCAVRDVTHAMYIDRATMLADDAITKIQPLTRSRQKKANVLRMLATSNDAMFSFARFIRDNDPFGLCPASAVGRFEAWKEVGQKSVAAIKDAAKEMCAFIGNIRTKIAMTVEPCVTAIKAIDDIARMMQNLTAIAEDPVLTYAGTIDKKTAATLQIKEDQSIVEEMPNLPLVYTQDTDFVRTDEVLAILETHRIPRKAALKMLKEFCQLTCQNGEFKVFHIKKLELDDGGEVSDGSEVTSDEEATSASDYDVSQNDSNADASDSGSAYDSD